MLLSQSFNKKIKILKKPILKAVIAKKAIVSKTIANVINLVSHVQNIAGAKIVITLKIT